MVITFRNRFITLTAGALIAASASALPPSAATARATVTAQHRPGSGAGRHEPWLTGNTQGRGLRWVRRGTVASAVGKIFFTLGHTDYVCSGVLVRGGTAAVVLTAAHCVSDGRQHATNWTFVPGYQDGRAPYGQYTARRFYVSPRWTGPGHGGERYDVAFVRVAPVPPDGGTRPARTPPGLPIRFAVSQARAELTRTYVFGYPARAPFSGQYANYCAGPARVITSGSAHRGSVRTACGMTAGDSGGPWLAGFRPRAGAGTVTAVTTFKLAGDPRLLYGAVLGPAARALYRAATGARQVSPAH